MQKVLHSIYPNWQWLVWMSIFLMVTHPLMVFGQKSVNCYFNQLCSCKLAHLDYDDAATQTDNQEDSKNEKEFVTPSFQGQFGIILSETSPVASNDSKSSKSGGTPEPKYSRLRIKPASLMAGAVTSNVAKQNIREVSCVGVPFLKSPDFPSMQITHIDLVDAGLEVIGNDVLSGLSVESVRFLDNKINYIEQDALREVGSTLKSLDLSYNQLTQFPFTPLSKLETLDWLNLHGNVISNLNDETSATFKNTLSTLFLGDNDLGQMPTKFFSTFKRLLWLNLDNNHMREVPEGSLPPSIVTLSITNNYITKFPIKATGSLPSLTWFTLRGNYIETLPAEPFIHLKRLDKLDLGENFLTSIPPNMFNKTLSVNDFNLDYNYIEQLGERAFAAVSPRRLYLGHNRITDMHNNTFGGLEHTLELVDLEGNRLTSVTPSFGDLRQLRYLFLGDNKLTSLPQDTFDSLCNSLKALSVSGNNLDSFPREQLRRCSSLSHLNLGYNLIEDLSPESLANWAGELDTLILRNNLIRRLEPRTFRGSPKLRELSLSFNPIEYMDSETFRDIATSLESLEISFGFKDRLFPESALKPLQKLLWLAMDNNDLEEISETALYSLGELQYLNLESNRLQDIPQNLLHKNVHKHLYDVRLSYNKLTSIKTGIFNGLGRLQTIILAGNLISDIELDAFKHMPKLSTVSITSNRLSSIAHRSFAHLENLQKLELQFNSLREFSLEAFENCSTNWDNSMTLNISHNLLQRLTSASPDDKTRSPPPFVRVLDASHNELVQVPKGFLDALSPALLSIDLSFNKISEIENTAFKRLSRLQELKLSHNQIEDLQKSSVRQLTGLQILDLSNNHLEVLQFGQFSGLSALRIVILSHNRLRSLPRDVFSATSVESIDLSWNEFVAMPNSALTEVSASLRHLNLSHNSIEHLDSTMFSNMPHLQALSFANNRLTVLPDNIFIGVGSLRTLDLSFNPLRVNFKSLCHYVKRLNTLRLAGVELETLPSLNLQHLTNLDLSENRLADIQPVSVEGMPNLRYLNLSRNKFLRLPAHSWPMMPYLKSLDISWNPLRVLTKESFHGLLRLQDLIVQHLPDLKRFDADSLSNLHYLTNLAIQSWPSIEKYKFRLGSVVSGLAPLRTLSARILERSGILTDQILGAFGPKLKELELTGPFHTITLDAFEGIESYELKLSIKNTNVKSLPNGFLKMFSNVAHLTLDISNNKLEKLEPDVLYENASTWEQEGTKILKGGLALQGNPWQCSCENSWLGRWLRRWMRETLQLHMSVAERNQNIQSIVRSISCNVINEERRQPLRHEISSESRLAATSWNENDNYDFGHNVTETNGDGAKSTYQRPLVDLNRDAKCFRVLPSVNSASSERNLFPVIILHLTFMTLMWTLSNSESLTFKFVGSVHR